MRFEYDSFEHWWIHQLDAGVHHYISSRHHDWGGKCGEESENCNRKQKDIRNCSDPKYPFLAPNNVEEAEGWSVWKFLLWYLLVESFICIKYERIV